MINKTNVFIVSQPFFPVPATRDGAIPFIIQDTIDCLSSSQFKVVSTWDEKMELLSFNRKKFHFVKPESMLLRGIKRLFAKRLNSYLIYDITYTKHLDMLISLIWYSILDKPRVMFIHTTRCEWTLNIIKVFSKRNIKFVWYHHTSEDQKMDEEHLSRLSMIDAHVSVSDYSKERFIEKVYPYDRLISQKSHVIKNGININSFKFNPNYRIAVRSEYEISEDMILILYIGKLTPRKGFHKLLDAYGLLSAEEREKTALLVVGAADYYTNTQTEYILKVQKKANRFDAKIIFTGYIPHERVKEFYCAADFLVFPSVEEEGMPLTILEAQAMRLPVISSNVGGIPEVIINNETGIIYQHDVDALILSQHIGNLIEDEVLRKKFGLSAEDNIRRKFCRERMAQDFAAVANEVVNA